MNRFLRLATSAAALVVISGAALAPAAFAQEAPSENRQIKIVKKKKLRPQFVFEGQQEEQSSQNAPSSGPKQFRFDFNEQQEADVAANPPAKPSKPQAKEFRFEETAEAPRPPKKLRPKKRVENETVEFASVDDVPAPKFKPKAKVKTITLAAAEPVELAGEVVLKPDKKAAAKFKPKLNEDNAVDVTEDATAEDVTEEAKAEAIRDDAVETKAADLAPEADAEEEQVIVKKIKRKKKIVYVYEDEEPSYQSYQPSAHTGSSCGQNLSY